MQLILCGEQVRVVVQQSYLEKLMESWPTHYRVFPAHDFRDGYAEIKHKSNTGFYVSSFGTYRFNQLVAMLVAYIVQS